MVVVFFLLIFNLDFYMHKTASPARCLGICFSVYPNTLPSTSSPTPTIIQWRGLLGRVGHPVFSFVKSGNPKFWEESLLSVFLPLVFMTVVIFKSYSFHVTPHMSPQETQLMLSTVPGTQCAVIKTLLSARNPSACRRSPSAPFYRDG